MSVRTCDRCTGTTKARNRCKNRTCHSGLCWQHLKKEQHLRIKPSQIPNAGLGLWTTKSFKAGDRVDVYKGEELTRQQVDARYPGDELAVYTICAGDDARSKCIDGRKTNSSAARFANDARGTAGLRNNVEIPRTVMKIKGKGVPANRELFLNYGATYWSS